MTDEAEKHFSEMTILEVREAYSARHRARAKVKAEEARLSEEIRALKKRL